MTGPACAEMALRQNWRAFGTDDRPRVVTACQAVLGSSSYRRGTRLSAGLAQWVRNPFGRVSDDPLGKGVAAGTS